jgi:hypothetical protein
MRIARSALGAVSAADYYNAACGWDCSGFWGMIDPCCMIAGAPAAGASTLGPQIQQTVGGMNVPADIGTNPKVFSNPPASGTPATYDANTGQCVGNCGNPTAPTPDQTIAATTAGITGTPYDPSSSWTCRTLGFGCTGDPSGAPFAWIKTAGWVLVAVIAAAVIVPAIARSR